MTWLGMVRCVDKTYNVQDLELAPCSLPSSLTPSSLPHLTYFPISLTPCLNNTPHMPHSFSCLSHCPSLTPASPTPLPHSLLASLTHPCLTHSLSHSLSAPHHSLPHSLFPLSLFASNTLSSLPYPTFLFHSLPASLTILPL